MLLQRIRIAVFLVAAAVAVGAAQANKPWPPGLQQVPEESPPISPEEALRKFHLPPGYRVELVASEPLIHDPVMIDWDGDGRMWAVEMPGYMPDINAKGEHEAIGKIVVLEDTNRDGRMDKRTVFQDGLVLARWLKVLDRGVLVAEPPNLWLFQDTNGDLKADRKELVTDQYGRREGNVEHNANSLLWALDNNIYTSEIDVDLRLKNGKFEVQKTLARGQWGITQDDGGRIFRNTNESALHVDLIPAHYYMRHPNLLRTRGSHESLTGQNGELNDTWPIRPTRGVNRGYQYGILRPDGTLAKFTSVCTPMIYRGDRLPAELYGNVFVVDPTVNLVSRIILGDNGTGLTAEKAYRDVRGEFLASTDERFRPVNLSIAPDGTLYVVDMYRGIIQHRGYMTEYLRDYVLTHKLEQPNSFGRIYRIVHENTKRDTTLLPMRTAPSQLVGLLSHPNGWRRDMAQQLLVERADTSVVPALRKVAVSGADVRGRLKALWVLDALDAIEPSDLMPALSHQNRDVRVSAVRLAERWLRVANHPMHGAVLKLLDDKDWAVRRQLAATLGELQPGSKEAAIASVLERYGDDPIAVDAALSGVRGSELAVLERLLQGTGDTPQRSAAITMLAATIVRVGEDAPVQTVLARVAETSRPAWQRSALLRGAEVALLAATMPGTPSRGAWDPNQPCPTCPGGRGEARGARAFPGVLEAQEPPAPPARAGGPSVTLTREPALVAVAAEKGELGDRAAKVMARIGWPGKPGVAPAAAALSAVDQKRFLAGQEIYKNICEGCHGAEGREQPGATPNIAGAPSVIGAPGVPIRVLLHGKEGAIGLMPAHGDLLNDTEIAAVLTYIRRAWGQTAAPIDATAVQQVRAANAGRTRAWTPAELAQIK
ncbi:MAG TPA: c-type cytochrome [Vicinamibacterales bacterium]|nr:c-type cytochrome [Vicinamibacterales bacterium]